MNRTSNKDCRRLVQSKTPFRGNNLFGQYEGDRFVVYSFGEHWPLFVHEDGTWFENSDRYSVSTARHRFHSHPRCPTRELPAEQLMRVATRGSIRVITDRLLEAA